MCQLQAPMESTGSHPICHWGNRGAGQMCPCEADSHRAGPCPRPVSIGPPGGRVLAQEQGLDSLGGRSREGQGDVQRPVDVGPEVKCTGLQGGGEAGRPRQRRRLTAGARRGAPGALRRAQAQDQKASVCFPGPWATQLCVSKRDDRSCLGTTGGWCADTSAGISLLIP